MKTSHKLDQKENDKENASSCQVMTLGVFPLSKGEKEVCILATKTVQKKANLEFASFAFMTWCILLQVLQNEMLY